MFDVSIQLVCSRKPGTLSRLIRDIKLFGLQYTGHDIQQFPGRSEITINGQGVLNCSRDRLIELLTEMPDILSVKELYISREGRQITTFKTQYSRDYIKASAPLSQAVLLAAEKRLAETLGPVSSFLVEVASQNCSNAGQLFRLLAKELNDDEERQEFLSIIDESG